MNLRWTERAAVDLVRLHEFLEPLDPAAAAGTVRSISEAVGRLPRFPRLGERLDRFDPREVRRLVIGDYELRYEIGDDTLHVLRIWHTRELR